MIQADVQLVDLGTGAVKHVGMLCPNFSSVMLKE
jgi:hypothetical protein